MAHCFLHHLLDRGPLLVLIYLYRNRHNSDQERIKLFTRLATSQRMFSHIHEYEADYFGLLLMTESGYDPKGATNVLKILSEHHDPKSPEGLSSHPATPKRIALIAEWADLLEKGELSLSHIKAEAKLASTFRNKV
eukprot:TRINITY_DN6958_c0_g1_i1.p1 TRINITY_DN6958_c0_g1~~TRINITY_DN6958_c0_g1_i1.p1  ORF type:complete len:159 (-),score=36.57 TRINITY_DN6958_c0_g1_i1:61-468(-)